MPTTRVGYTWARKDNDSDVLMPDLRSGDTRKFREIRSGEESYQALRRDLCVEDHIHSTRLCLSNYIHIYIPNEIRALVPVHRSKAGCLSDTKRKRGKRKLSKTDKLLHKENCTRETEKETISSFFTA